MNSTRRTMKILVFFIVLSMLAASAAYVIVVQENSEKWLNRATNIRVREMRNTTLQGTVYDSSMKPLSWSETVGTRSYISDTKTRLALCHTIGDQKNMNSSGVEYRHATTLLGMDMTRTEYMLQKITGTQTVGYDIVLTVNAPLSAYLASLFPEGSTGGAVIYNYKTGAILAKVSLPAFDPANMDAEVAADAYYDNVLQSQNAPGSTFKIITLASTLAADPGTADETYSCAGLWSMGRYSIRCAGGTAHGSMKLYEAFAKSCNITFSALAYQTGATFLRQTAESFGFNTNFNFVDLVMNPSHCLDKSASDGEVIQTGIGQGTTEVTVMHMAMISGAIANGGVMMEPKLIKEVRKHSGETIKEMQSAVYKTVCSEAMSKTLAKYMNYAVTNGTGTRAQIDGYTAGYICGKTGSAEWGKDKENTPTHAWYTGFIYGDDAHPYAVTVLVKGGGSGGSVAAPIASKALSKAIELGVY